MEKNNKDMSLFDFLRSCWFYLLRMIKEIFSWLMKVVRLGLRYWYIMILFGILGVGVGYMWSQKRFSRFYGDITIRVTEGMKEPVRDGIYMFLASGADLKAECGLDPEILKHLKWVKMYNVIDAKNDSTPDFVDYNRSVSQSDTFDIVMTDRIHLTICMKGYDKFYSFEPALQEFMHRQPQIVMADSIYKNIARERLDYFTREVARLDSFTTFDYFQRPRAFSVEFRSVVISEKQYLHYQDLMYVLENKNYLQAQVENTPNILNYQTDVVISTMPPIRKYAYSFAGAILLGLVVALIIEERKKVIAFLKERK